MNDQEEKQIISDMEKADKDAAPGMPLRVSTWTYSNLRYLMMESKIDMRIETNRRPLKYWLVAWWRGRAIFVCRGNLATQPYPEGLEVLKDLGYGHRQ